MSNYEPEHKRVKIDPCSIVQVREKVLKELNECLDEHDMSRKLTQEKLRGICNNLKTQINNFEDTENKKIEEQFERKNNCLQNALNELRTSMEGEKTENLTSAIYITQIALGIDQNNCVSTHKKRVNDEGSLDIDYNNPNSLMEMLRRHIEENEATRIKYMESLQELCQNFMGQIDELRETINEDLEKEFTQEDNRLQRMVNEFRSHEGKKILSAAQKVQAELLIKKVYDIETVKANIPKDTYYIGRQKSISLRFSNLISHYQKYSNAIPRLSDLYKLRATSVLRLDKMNTVKVSIPRFSTGKIYLEISRNPDEESVLHENGFGDAIIYKASLSKDTEDTEYPLRKERKKNIFSFVPDTLKEKTTYKIKVKAFYEGKKVIGARRLISQHQAFPSVVNRKSALMMMLDSKANI